MEQVTDNFYNDFPARMSDGRFITNYFPNCDINRKMKKINEIVTSDTGVKSVNELLTLHFGPRDILLNISLDFEDGLSANQVEESTTRLESRIKQMFPEISRIFIEAQSRMDQK